MPPTPLRAQRRPCNGSVAGTLQKTSCAASRRLDQPASSEGVGGLGDGDGAGDSATRAAWDDGSRAASATRSDAHPTVTSAMLATARRPSFLSVWRESAMAPPERTTAHAHEPEGPPRRLPALARPW